VPTLHTLGLFAAATIAIIVIPGPSMLYILARGLTAGQRAAVCTALGVETASLVFVVATAVGLAAVIAASAVALAVVKWLGVAYLVFLGLRALLGGSRPLGITAVPAARPRVAYREGLLVGLSNPKVVLFFLSLFPQFVDPARGSVAVQVLILGAVFVALGLAADLTNALLAGRIGAWLRSHPAIERRRHVAEAVSYLGLGAAAAFSSNTPHRS
jgi:threonine/homoserine/homoserine lactone efflux protein